MLTSTREASWAKERRPLMVVSLEPSRLERTGAPRQAPYGSAINRRGLGDQKHRHCANYIEILVNALHKLTI